MVEEPQSLPWYGDDWHHELPRHTLLLPMRDWRSGELVGGQVIYLENNEWTKKVLPGSRAKGAVMRLGPRVAGEYVLCEGYATALSVQAAIMQMRLSAQVVTCFSAGNLAHVGALLSGRRYAFADDDPEKLDPNGRQVGMAGERAARKAGIPYCMSPVVGEDCNDLHQRAGLFAVVKAIMDVRNSAAPQGKRMAS